QDFGFGVRVLVKGTWGFAASSIVTPEEIRRVTTTAVDAPPANAAFQRKRVTLAPVDPVTANWKSAFEKDPFDVPLDDKIQFLLALNGIAMKTTGVSFVNSSMAWVNEQRFLATSEGSRIEQYLIRGQPQFNVTAVSRETGDFQTRRSLGGPQARGYEYIETYPWQAEARQAADEAVAKLKATSVEPGRYDLVIDPTNLWPTTRELAPLIGRKKSYGCLNADSWGSVPFARMPNISLEPGAQDTSLDELVAGVEKGILIYGDGSWSIDQQRYNFQFGGQTFREISKGKIAGMMRDVEYQSRTTEFWSACDGVGGRS